MVHKKYIKRGGKVFGPYLYENYRVNGITKTRYLGLAPKEKNLRGNNNFFILAGIIGLVFLSIFLFSALSDSNFSFGSFTGFITGENISNVNAPATEDVSNEIEIQDITPPPTNENITIPVTNESASNETAIENITIPETNETIILPENESIVIPEENITIPVNETTKIPEENITPPENESIVIPEENITIENETSIDINATNFSVETVQYKARIGEAVKWKKIVSKSSEGKIVVELPQTTFNVSVREIDEENNVLFSMTGGVISEPENNNPLSGFFRNILSFFGITGKAIEEQIPEPVQVEITEDATNLEVEYYTEAPESAEIDTSNGKQITISGPEQLHYTDVLAYTNIPNQKIKLSDAGKIKLYSITNGKTEITFTAVDSDKDGIIDYVEWNVPHLSEQVYELIIEISKAEHLNSNKEFISDIYEQVRALDGVWSETINNNEYVRVTFEKKLTSSNDITLYPRVVSGNPKVEVYEKDKNELIAEFTTINSNEYNKVYLINLQDSQDTFDLKVLNGDIQLDYIVDPYYNQTDGFSTSAIGADSPAAIATNGSDFWITDMIDDWVYHTDALGNNMSDGFSTSAIGADSPYGMATNGSDFWVVDYNDDFVYHTDALGNNMSDGFSTSALGSDYPRGITTNGSDFWITDNTDVFVYHTDALGNNISDGFSISAIGVSSSYGITTNGSDFWIVDDGDDFVYHTNRTGGNMTDGFSASAFGSIDVRGITTNVSYSNWASPTDFWIADSGDDFVYHLGLTDVFPPVITINYPNNASTFFTNTDYKVNINYTATDDGTLDTCWYSNDSGVNNYTLATCGTNITGATWDVSNNITIWANDSANNVGVNYVVFYVANTTNVDNCGYLTIANKDYHLTQGVNSVGTCFTIVASNVTLNCQGYKIDYCSQVDLSGYGVYSEQNFTNISNCIINEITTTTLGRHAVYFFGTSYGNGRTISNNNITVNSSLSTGIYMGRSNNTLISGNNITSRKEGINLWYTDNHSVKDNAITAGNTGLSLYQTHRSTFSGNNISISTSSPTGLSLSRISYNTFSNNNITSSQTSAKGIYFSSLASNNTFSNDSIYLSGVDARGIHSDSAVTNNSFSGISVSTPSTSTSGIAVPIYLGTSHINFSVSDSILNGTFRSLDFYILKTIKGGEWNFTNVTMPNGSVFRTNWTTGGNGTLNVFWYLNVNVSDSKTNITIGEANVTITDALGTYITSMNTSADGSISRQILQQYEIINKTQYTWYSPYNVIVIKAGGYAPYSNASVNLTNNIYLNILLIRDTTPPDILIQYPTNNTNTTNNKLNINYTYSDNAAIESCWYFNDTSSVNLSLGSGANCVNITNITWSDGNHNVTIYVNDTTNNLNWSTVFFTVDTTPPNIEIVYPSNNTNTNDPNLDINYTVSGTDIDSCWYSNDSMLINITLENCSTNITDVTWSLGQHHVTIWANDTLNNVGSTSVTFNHRIGYYAPYYNQTDGFSISALGSVSPCGITTNGSDFWIIDYNDGFVYHTDALGNNMTDGFKTSAFGSVSPYGITTNGSDFWIADYDDDFVYHVNAIGGNMSDGFSTSALGSDYSTGITTNGSDFWVVDYGDGFAYHTDALGNNMTDGFSISAIGVSSSYGITTNGSDFWITDSSDRFVYHTDALGNNITDGFSTLVFGSNSPLGITTNVSYSNWATPTDFWIVDDSDDFVYHLSSSGDVFPPIITITSPANDSTQFRDPLITYTVSDESLSSCWYSDNGGVDNITLTNCQNISEPMHYGENNIIIWANDSANNVGVSYVTFYINIAKYFNQTDGFSTSAISAGTPYGITTNGSDFWIIDRGDRAVYHTNLTGGNMTEGFSTSAIGAGSPFGITTNGSDFWIADENDDFVYHTDALGNNMTDGFKISAGDIRAITTNGSDFWITDGSDDFVYHVNSTGGNMSDGFSTLPFNSDSPLGITTNGSDFWIVDESDDFVYHVNSTGGNMSDGFSTSAFGSNNPCEITTNVSYSNWATPTDFWIVDSSDDFVYHLSSSGDVFPPIITINYPNNASTFYTDTDYQVDINFTISDESFDTLWYSNDSGKHNKTIAYRNITGIAWDASNNLTIWANDSGNNVEVNYLTFFIKNSTDVDTCGYLMITNRTYDLQNSVSSSENCFTILANNITINCKNNAINYGSSTTGNGVYNRRYNFTNISNCIINEVSLGREAIYMYQSDSPIISYNNITIDGSNLDFVYLYSSKNTLISNNNLTSTTSDGIWIDSSSNNTISNNNIKSYGLCIDARHFYDSFILGNNMTQSVGSTGALKLGFSSNNLISNNSIYGTLANWGIRLSDFASNNTFLNNIVNLSTANSKGVYFESATTNNSFSGMNILTPSTSTSGVTAPIAITKSHTNFSISDSILNGTYRSLDFYIPSGINGGMWNFTNVTMPNGSAFRTNWTTGSNGTLNVFWYLNVNVTNVSGTALENANITISSRVVYHNQTDGFSTLIAGAENSYGLTTNGSDFWWFDDSDKAIYHTNATGGNMSDGFSTSALGASNALGITTNGSDFWITDMEDDFIYHTNATGGNMSDGFSTSALGSNTPVAIATNGSDFWITDAADGFAYHTNATGGNMSDGFSTTALGSENPYGITTNGSDFWITDCIDNFVYHLNSTGGNMSDGFSTTALDLYIPYGITTSVSLPGTWATPTDFWIMDPIDDFVYHLSAISDYQYSQLTLATGFIPTQTLQEYNNVNNTVITYYSNYTLTAFLAVYESIPKSVNMSYNQLLDFILYIDMPHIQIISPQNNTNTTNVNLNINYTASDVTLSYCWYSNDTFGNVSLASCLNNITTITWGQGQHNITVYVNDSVGNLNSSSISFTVDSIPPYITITSPDNTSFYALPTIDFNATVNDTTFIVDSCLYSLDGAANVTMVLNASKTFANYSYTGITHGYHNLTISCNDSLNNWGSATESDFKITLPDLSIVNVSMPEIIYSVITFMPINVSNQVSSAVSDVNVSCYFNDVIFESHVITSISENSSYLTNCTMLFIPSLNQKLNVIVDPNNLIVENNETNNNYTIYFNITQLANVTLSTVNITNTTDTINVEGLIIRNNGTYLPNQKFTVKVNNITVSSDTRNYSNFASGTADETNISNVVQLNLSSEGNLINYADTYTTTSYKTDSHVVNYSNEGWYSGAGILFHKDDMLLSVGNITYRFDSITKFYNASAYIETYTPANPSGGNTSLWYSFDDVTWNLLNSTILEGTIIGREIPDINGKATVYIKINSDTFGWTKENPVTRFEFNYTNYNYSALGSFVSPSMRLANITYTILRWEQLLNGGNIKIQFRESDDNITWGGWGNNYTNNLDNDISVLTKAYIQYRVWLSTTNQSRTPILYQVNISYFNATTNSTGGYNTNITVPTDSIGIVPLEVNAQTYASNEGGAGIMGSNTTNITIWARTELLYNVVKNYSSESNYSVLVNFTRSDTGRLVNGTINVTIYNSTDMLSQTCYADRCVADWLVPSQLGYGNYTINMSASNQTAYYINTIVTTFADYLEESNTLGTLYLPNYTISDYNPSQNYTFYLNATINNTGKASINGPYVWSSSLEGGAGFATVTEITPCSSKLWPGENCNASIMVVVKSGLGARNDSVTWRANWTDNDGSIVGGAGYITSTSYIVIESNATMIISNYSINKTVQHESTDTFNFDVLSIGTDAVTNINISLIEGAIPSSWLLITPNWKNGLVGGQTQSIEVNISVPVQTEFKNYSGIINVSSSNTKESYLNLTIEVPLNLSWYFVDATNFSFNNSYSLNTPGIVANYTIVNMGNTNLTMNITYAPRGACVGSPYDYSCVGTLFYPNDGIYNPTQVNITKGESTGFTLYQEGSATSLTDVRVIVKFYNESANPTIDSVEDRFNIYEMPPNITGVWFYLDGIPGNISEISKNLTIKVRATDDVNINETATKINVTYGATTVVLNATSLCPTSFDDCIGGSGSRTVANFTANYTPAVGTYTVKAIVYDTIGNSIVSSPYTFTSYGTTRLNITKNISSITISTIDKANKYTFNVNYSVNNTGRIYAYNVLLNFSNNTYLAITPIDYSFNNMSSGTNSSKVFQVNISELTPPGAYNLTAVINWKNADNTLNSSLVVLNLTVRSNKSLDYSPSSLDFVVPTDSTNSSVLTITNTGNDLLTEMNLNCYTGTLCTNFVLSYNESNFNIASNNSKQVNISITAPSGLAAGTYTGTINISEKNISKTIDISATIPANWTWIISPISINKTIGISSSGDIQEAVISNTGNVNISFIISSSNSSIVSTNVSSLTAPFGTDSYFMINYSAPGEEGSYIVTLNITNISASPIQRNITINITTIKTNVTILYPTSSLPLQNVTSGMNISIMTNVTYAGVPVTENITWSVTINASSCLGANSTYSSSGWNITCLAPNIADGKSYDVTAIMTHPSYGTISETEADSIIYKDISPPTLNSTRNNINKGQNINLRVNITDNVAVASASAILTYPNLSQTNLSLSLSAGFYVNTSLVLDEPGEYLVNYTAGDTSNNVNSTSDWFEVFEKYDWNINLKDYNSQPVTNVNITLLKPDTQTILLSGMTNSTGGTILNINKRAYDINISIDKEEIIMKNVNLTNITQSNISLNLYKITDVDLSSIIPLYKPLVGIASNSTGFDSNVVYIIFNYTGYNYDSVAALKVIKCETWDYINRVCIGTWITTTDSVNTNTKKVQGNSTGFSSYFLAERKCGNGLCELNYAETTTTCSDDCKETTVTVSGGGGGGGGGGASIADIETLLKNYVNIGGVKIDATSIYKEMFAGESATIRITLSNSLASPTTVSLSAEGDIADFIFFESSEIDLGAHEARDVLIKIVLPKETYPGNYDGDLIMESGGSEGKVPVTIRVLVPEGKLLDIKILPLKPTVAPGGILKLQTDLLNLGQTKKIDVQFDLQLLDINTGNVMAREEEAFAVETTFSTIKNLSIPIKTPVGKYIVKATAYYSNLEQQFMQATSIAYVFVEYPFLQRKLLGIPLWIYLLVAFLFASVDGVIILSKWLDYRKKRFKVKVEFEKLPHLSPSSIFIGKIAETGIRAFLDLNKLQMHTLIAGSTGSGKTIAAQDIVEGALIHKKSVIIFDPTAQWTGFFRPTDDKGMLKRYKYFDMKIKDARGFNGTIRTIHDPYELINLKEYMDREGEITIFDISNLTPADIDIIVASTTEQIFKSQPEESRDLKALIVYDEVHRLLPKFGGSGKGFVQLERGAREFRKWGFGLVLISQVLSDFIGEIKANIGTEIQMGTRYEGDLERISLKYGEDMLKAVVKEQIGTGMIVNAEYNSGKPYFVSFRPLYHSTRRLSTVDLKKYEHYFDQIEDLAYQIAKLESYGIDALDLKLELKISKDKVKSGQFQMVDMYLDSLVPVVLGHWKSLGKNPEHLVREKIAKTEVLTAISVAEKERERYLKEHPEQQISLAEEVDKLRKDVEEKRKKGKNTLILESKIMDLQNRLKPFKGKINARDAEGIRLELDSLKRELDRL